MNRPEPTAKLNARAAAQETPDDLEAEWRSPFTHKQIRAVYLGLALAMFSAALNQTVIATALPTIGRAFGDLENLSWVITAYLLTGTVVSPLYGKLSDIYGRRAVILAALGIFIAGSLAAAVAPNMPMLILARALQGLGGGGIVPMVQTTIADVVTPRERGRYQAYMAVVWVCAGTGGPVLGGFLADYVDWSAIFWMNIPLGLFAALLIHRQLKLLPSHSRKHTLDLLGAGLMMTSAVTLLLALTWGGTRFPWVSFEIVALIALSGLLALGFSMRQTRAHEPFLPVTLLRNPVMRMGTASNALAFAAQLALTIFMPIYYQLVGGLSATEAGLALIPTVVLTTPGSVAAGRVMMHFPRYKWASTIGMIVVILCIGAVTLRPDLPLALVITLMGIAAFGAGLLFPTATVAVQNAVPRHMVGTATGTVNFFRQLLSALAITIMGAILLAGLGFTAGRSSGPQVLTAATGTGAAAPAEVFRWVFATAEAFFILSLGFWLLMEERPLAGPAPGASSTETV